jgi:hypothetical protein
LNIITDLLNSLFDPLVFPRQIAQKETTPLFSIQPNLKSFSREMLIDESVLDQKLNGIYQTISMNVGTQCGLLLRSSACFEAAALEAP